MLLRLVLAFIATSVAYFLGTVVIGDTSVTMTPEEMSQAGMAVIAVSLIGALVSSFLILRSPWHRLRLIGAVMLVHFGLETFMAQIETLYFNSALQMGTDMFAGIVAAGAVRALVFAPLAVLILGKMKKPAQPPEKEATGASSGWRECLAALAVLYVVVYFVFGYFVAWQRAETRLLYSATTAIKPFLAHYRDLFFKEDPAILPFQLLRGALWTALTIVTVWMIRARPWETSLAVALTFAVLLALPLGLSPNPYVPPLVRQAHSSEQASSMLVLGGIAGWVLHGSAGREEMSVHHQLQNGPGPVLCL
jgi:hypothetical protein